MTDTSAIRRPTKQMLRTLGDAWQGYESDFGAFGQKVWEEARTVGDDITIVVVLALFAPALEMRQITTSQ